MREIVLPRLSESMEEGTILAWLVSDGAAVSEGDELVEIETDKASMTYAADADGVLHIVAHPGDTVPVGAPIARLLGPGDDPSASTSQPVAVVSSAAVLREAPPAQGPVRASPVARRLAREQGVDLEQVTGTGRGGRISREDVEALLAHRPADPAAAPRRADDNGHTPVRPESAAPAKGEATVLELSRVQSTVARRMSEAKATVPEFAVAVDADVEDVLVLRERLKAEGERDDWPSFNDFVVRACAVALTEHPRVNGAWKDGRFELYSRINIGVAVAGDDTLVVPTIFDADTKTVHAIGRETSALAARVRDGSITPPELAGGTFTLSNLGMFGVARFTPIVNGGQAAILGVGAAVPRFVPAADGAPEMRRICELTLVSDHRILYGVDAARFVARVGQLLSRPLSLLAG